MSEQQTGQDATIGWSSRTWSAPLADDAYRAVVWNRLLGNILVTGNGCWEWQRYITADGYGKISVKRRMITCHQVSLAITRGSLWDQELEIDHLCRNRSCCNPDHLELVTQQENYRRGLGIEPAVAVKRNKTHCKHGHLLDEKNTYIRPSGPRAGTRTCRRCRTEGMSRKYWAEKNREAS